MERIHFAPASKANPVNLPYEIRRSLPSDLITYYKSMNNWVPYDNFKATVLSPLCSSTRFETPWEYDAVPIWGIRPISSKYWEGIRSGDFVIFYSGNGAFPYIGRIDQKDVDVELGKSVWPCYPLTAKRGSNGTGEPWSHIFYFDMIWKASIPKEWIQHLRWSQDIVIRRFASVPEKRLRRIGKNTGKSPSEIVEKCTGKVASLAIKWNADRADRFRTLVGDESQKDEILRIAIEPYGMDINYLSDSAREEVVDCVQREYS